jgi:hypothetical protein
LTTGGQTVGDRVFFKTAVSGDSMWRPLKFT